MKLVVAVVQGKDSDTLLTALNQRGFRATQIESAGGFLRESNSTLMIGVQDEYVDEVRQIVRDNCHSRTRFVNPLMPIIEPGEFYIPNPVEVQVGGATVFVLKVERYERFGFAS
ncbi:MAG: cyclic-di-AMP receptor [Thermomicrobiales bacterium]